ncbi:MAG: DUF2339 domain-containing protein [Bacteroidetes bacterium]|nr:DUF2339 domain-containing protein [Bacteroidota bacterium]
MPAYVAYVGMALLAAVAIWRSLAHASLFLAMMSGLVGFSAPMVLQTGVMNTGGLFTYLGFIAVMMLATVYGLRKWFSLYFVALGATLLWWIVWNIGGYGTDGYQQPAAAFSIIADILLFAGALVAIRWRALEIFDRAKVISTMIVLWLLCLVVNSTTFDYALWSDVGVALVPVLIVSAAWLMVRRGEPTSALAHGLGILVIAVACLVPWTCSYDSNLQDLTLIVIAALGTILGARMQYSGMRLAADIIMGLQLLSIVTPSYVLDLPLGVMVVLNTTMLHYVLIALYMWFLMEQRPSLRQLAPAVLTYALTLQAQLALQNAQYPWWIQVMMPISLWTLMQGITVMLTRRRDLAYADMYATVGMAIGVLSWLSMGLQWPSAVDHTGLFNMRVVSGISIVAMQLLLWFTMPRPTGRFNDAMVIWPSIMLITFLLTTMETITPQWKIITEASDMHGWESMVVRDLMDRMQLLLSCAWIVYAAIVVAIGFVKRVKVARLTGMGVLGVAVLKVFLYDLSNLQTPFRIISFIVLGLILFGASYLYARFKDRINA